MLSRVRSLCRRHRFRMVAGLICLAGGASCGDCDSGGFDAGVPDATPPGTFSLAWTLIDQTTGQPVTCDKLDPNATVFVKAQGTGPLPGGVESFSCSSLQGTSATALAPGTYSFLYELHVPAGAQTVTVATAATQAGVVIRSGQDTALAPIAFQVNAAGRLELMLHAGASGNCTGGAGITGFAISLEHAGGAADSGCAPVVFTLSGGGSYSASDCSSPPVTRCIAADETLSVDSLPSGPYRIHVRGKEGALDCWFNDDALRVPPQGRALSETLNLALQSETPGCQ